MPEAAAVPLTEYDADTTALIEPVPYPTVGPMPPHLVVCFFGEVIDEVCAGAEVVTRFLWADGEHPVYRLPVGDRDVAVVHPGVGAPIACGVLEDAIATGCRAIVACGGAGAVVSGLALGHVVVPTGAVRDEGTSFHYAPPSREIGLDVAAVGQATALLDERGIPYATGLTWTTDAPYRETRAKIAARRAEGCLTVEMETAAFAAVCRHRGVPFAQYLYAGDDVSGQAWDHRSWQTSSARRDLFWLAAEAVLRL